MEWTNSLKGKLPKLTQEEIDNSDNPMSIKEIEFVVKNLSTKKTLGPDGFNDEFYQTFKQKVIPVLCKLFWKIGEKRTIPNSFGEASILI